MPRKRHSRGFETQGLQAASPECGLFFCHAGVLWFKNLSGLAAGAQSLLSLCISALVANRVQRS